MKIMGRVAGLILLVVVSVCCVLCFVLPPKQSGVLECHYTIYISKNENYELCILAGFFFNQITTGKKTTGKKGTVVWLSVGINLR
jgi:hypothetical protein